MPNSTSLVKIILGLLILSVFQLLVAPISLKSQLPESQAWLLKFDHSPGSEKWQSQKISFLSNFNPGGYNNQPKFTADGSLLLSFGIGETTDIILLHPQDGIFERLTQTTESEFSPAIHPSNKYLSFVRLENDGVQRVWKVPLDGSSYGSPFTPLKYTVGYYQWLQSEKLALFLLEEEGNRLIAWDPVTNEETLLTDRPGRCLDVDSEGNLYYTVIQSQTVRHIHQFNPISGETTRVVRMIPDGSEDFCLGPDDILITSADGMIMSYKPGKDAYWIPRFSIPLEDRSRISRIASDKNDRLCIISK
ncbi:MAG: hypothetical protein EA409_05330 [Saprospirales bacterium]|nr:MAG: hypothetical protein EA409_05330 [Saprospirales bacterium]